MNLTREEMLQHRHLSLLRALGNAGVKVECDETGKWTVDRFALLDDNIERKVTIDTLDEARVREAATCTEWGITVHVDRERIDANWHGNASRLHHARCIPYSGKVYDLLCQLHTAILTAPAKA